MSKVERRAFGLACAAMLRVAATSRPQHCAPLATARGTDLPAARKAFEGCDCLVAVGVRFAEPATGGYGMEIPDNLIHIDMNSEVFDKNYPAKVGT